MADWRTYAKAARNTARKQAPGVKRAMSDSARRASDRAGVYARAARTATDAGTRETREKVRRDRETWTRTAKAAGVVAGRKVKQADIGGRLMAALRDALLVGGSLFVIWFVLKSAGLVIPPVVLVVVIVVLMIARFAYALFGQFFGGRKGTEHADGMHDEHDEHDGEHDRSSDADCDRYDSYDERDRNDEDDRDRHDSYDERDRYDRRSDGRRYDPRDDREPPRRDPLPARRSPLPARREDDRRYREDEDRYREPRRDRRDDRW